MSEYPGRLPAILVACPECGMQPTEPCIGPDFHPISFVHRKRIEQAIALSTATEEGKNVLITDDSILNTGLV